MIRIPSPNIGLTKSYPLLFILSVRQLHRFHLPRNQSKTRRSIPVYLHFHIPGPDNDPSVYSQYPPLAGAVLIGAITTHRMQYPPIDRWNQNPLRCPQPPFHSYLKRYGLHTPADYTLPFPFILALLLTQAFLHTLVRLSSEQCHRLIKILTPVRRTVTGHITLSMPFLHMIIPSLLIHHHNTLIRQPSAQVISTLLIPLQQTNQKPPSSMRRHREGTLPSYIFT